MIRGAEEEKWRKALYRWVLGLIGGHFHLVEARTSYKVVLE